MKTAGATDQAGRGRVRVEQGAKRVRAYLGGELLADTTRPRLVWEVPYYPRGVPEVGSSRRPLIFVDQSTEDVTATQLTKGRRPRCVTTP